jgi:transposase
MDLTKARQEELLAVIAELEKVVSEQQKLIDGQNLTIKQQNARIAELEAKFDKGGPKGMPGLKPESTRHPETQKPRKKRPHGFARVRAVPTEQVIHVVDECPECGTRLKGGSIKRSREVIELPIVPVQVVEHVFMERECPICRKRLEPKDALAGLVVGKQRLGINLVSLIATLREEGRQPIRTIQWYLATFHQLHLSVGAIVAAIKQVAELGQTAVEEVRDRIRASSVVRGDETGWRENGVNGYVWTFSTATERYFVRKGRNKEVVDEVLGEKFSGVLVSDFYAAYNHYPGLHQRCWAHLLRDIHNLKELYPDDKELRDWAEAVHEIFEKAKAFSSPKERERLRKKQHFEDKLLQLCRPFLERPDAVQRRLCKRINSFLSELFVFVADPAVPADNNGAERSLRHLVTSRKISGGTRSEKGTQAKMTSASLFGTWRAHNLNPFSLCRQLLISPKV